MALDPVMFSTAQSIFTSIANEMGSVMLLSAYSSIAREAKDTSTCLLDPEGRVVAQAVMIPMHMNSLSSAVAWLRENFDLAATQPDEVYVMNHPYSNGQHLHDIILMLPIFESNRLCGFAGSISHHVDMGGGAIINANATELFQEGLIIPPMKLKEDMALTAASWRRCSAPMSARRAWCSATTARSTSPACAAATCCSRWCASSAATPCCRR
jgi:N-methylhydantoinase B